MAILSSEQKSVQMVAALVGEWSRCSGGLLANRRDTANVYSLDSRVDERI